MQHSFRVSKHQASELYTAYAYVHMRTHVQVYICVRTYVYAGVHAAGIRVRLILAHRLTNKHVHILRQAYKHPHTYVVNGSARREQEE